MCDNSSPDIELERPANPPSILPEAASSEVTPPPRQPYVEGYRLEILEALDC
jgi:hypothetical protein